MVESASLRKGTSGGQDMSSVASVGNGSSTGTIQKNTLGKDEFFQMLIAQLKHQDPLNPMDGTDFTAQLAQFSSLEQLSNMNASLETVAAHQVFANQIEAVSLIGKEIAAQGDVMEIDGTPVTLIYSAAENISKGTVSIYNSSGSLVKKIEVGSQQQGLNSVQWDCSGIESGSYYFAVEGTNLQGESVNMDTYVTGTVTGVTFNGGSVHIQIGDVDVPFEDVVSVVSGT